MNPSPTALDKLKLGRCYWITFRVLWPMLFPKSCVYHSVSGLSFIRIFRHFFWRYMLSFYLLLQILLSKVFPKKHQCFIILVTGLRIISPHPRHFEQVCSIISGRCSVFLRNLLKPNQANRAGKMSAVLISAICNVYEIVTYDLLHSQYWGLIKMVDMASKYIGNIKDWRLFLAY